jgi:hypothetical protein
VSNFHQIVIISEVPEERRHETTIPTKSLAVPKKVLQTIPAITNELPEVRESIVIEKKTTEPSGNIVFRKEPKEIYESVPPLETEVTRKPDEVPLKQRPVEVNEEVKPIFEDRSMQPERLEVTMDANIVRKPVFGREPVVSSGRSPLETVKSLARFRKSKLSQSKKFELKKHPSCHVI